MAELLPGTRVRMQRYKAGQHTELATVVGPENKPGHFRWVGCSWSAFKGRWRPLLRAASFQRVGAGMHPCV